MSEPTPPPDLPPGTTAALELDTLPNRPLRAKDVAPLIPKEIG